MMTSNKKMQTLTLFDILVASLMEDFKMSPAEADRVVQHVKDKHPRMDIWEMDSRQIPNEIIGAWYRIVKKYRLLLTQGK